MDALAAWLLIIIGFVVLVVITSMKEAKEWEARPPNLRMVYRPWTRVVIG